MTVKSLIVAATLALGVTTTAPADDIAILATQPRHEITFDASEVKCLARMLYHEARGEKTAGKYAVAQVTINRTNHPEFPPTICKVIKAKNAYPWAARDTTNYASVSYREAVRLAKEIMYFEHHGIEWGPKLTRNALFFNGVRFTGVRYKFTGKIGGHLFYDLRPRE